jgi:hypothetical protein
MASIFGPQWLCECNKSGSATTVAKAGQEAALHFLSHEGTGEGLFAVSVYKERNDWIFTVSTTEKAQELAYPIQMVSPGAGASTLTTSFALPPGATVQVDFGQGSLSRRYTLSSSPRPYQPPQGIELGMLTMAQASEQFRAMMENVLAGPRYGPSVSGSFTSGT